MAHYEETHPAVFVNGPLDGTERDIMPSETRMLFKLSQHSTFAAEYVRISIDRFAFTGYVKCS